MLLAALNEIPPDTGSPGYVTAAVIVSAVLVLAYLLIVVFRVRDSARRLEALEARLDAVGERASGPPAEPATHDEASPVGDPASVAAAAERLGVER
ncbi:hypothetical protein AB0L40_17225 [Patulibacter sp. NPDC049589]|uniref:hypothetical protein n=1 Tax=Patulibacter sp. NPDC049589 TaxID=3154731 RepID=UPI0034132FA4